MKKKVVPLPNSDSNQILPPEASIIFLTIHKPTPLESDLFFNFLKISKTKEEYLYEML